MDYMKQITKRTPGTAAGLATVTSLTGSNSATYLTAKFGLKVEKLINLKPHIGIRLGKPMINHSQNVW